MDESNLKITSIEPARRDTSQAVVHVGGQKIATLSVGQVGELGLTADKVVEPELLERVREAGRVNRAFRAATKRLSRRAMSLARISEKLSGLGFEESVVEEATGRLRVLGLIDDESMGRELIRETRLRRPAGAKLLSAKLVSRGIEEGLAERLVAEEVGDADAVLATAMEAAGRWLRVKRDVDPVKRRGQLWAFLGGRGFESDVIERVVDQVVGGAGDDASWEQEEGAS